MLPVTIIASKVTAFSYLVYYATNMVAHRQNSAKTLSFYGLLMLKGESDTKKINQQFSIFNYIAIISVSLTM